MAYPFFLGIYLSMTDKMVGFADFSFVGFENFQLLLRDQIFHRTVANTLIYSFVTVPFKLLLGLGLALVLNQTFHFSRFIRAGLLLPWIVPTAISSLAWLMLFDSVLSPISWVLKELGHHSHEHQLPRRSLERHRLRLRRQHLARPSVLRHLHSRRVCRPSPQSFTRRRRSMAPTPCSVSSP